MKSITEFRLVAYIFPETSWAGTQTDESDFPRIATEDQKGHPRYGISMREVGHPSGEPNGLMVYINEPYLPEESTLEAFMTFKEKLDHALSLPVMHRGDFTHIFEE